MTSREAAGRERSENEKSMIKTGKCPKCEKTISHLLVESLEAWVGIMASGGKYIAVTYCCPSCRAVLGAGLDPLALKEDTAQAVVDRLKKGR